MFNVSFLNSISEVSPLTALDYVIAVLCRRKMTEQQGTPDQLPAEKGQGGAGATYKVTNWTRALHVFQGKGQT